ncbi:MAG: DUF885 domain-containing protein [Thermoplasmata archaeon]|nr:DUF885 domain-containing protein [Thermoplasmata archaeon]
MASPAFDSLNERMLLKLLEINPDMATMLGKHDPYDHHLPHGGVKRLQDNLKLLIDWTHEAEEISTEGGLSRDQQVSLEVLRMSLELQEFALYDYPLWRMYPDALEQPGWTIFTMLGREYAPLEDRMAGVSSRINQLPRYLSQFRERFKDAQAVRPWTGLSIETCDAYPAFLSSVKADFCGKISEDLHKELMENCDKSAEALESHRDWLSCLLESGTDEFAMGEEKLAKLLRIRGFDLTPSRILEIAEGYLADLTKERRAVAKRISPDGDERTVTETLRKDCRETFEMVLQETVDETRKAMRFIIGRNLASIDTGAALEIVETPEFLRPALPVAALMMPARFEELQSGAYLMTRPREAAEIRSLWNRSMIINTTVHEAYPGHFHQGVLSNTMPWMHQLSLMFVSSDTMTPSYETGEGWAHYCETMMYDEGFEATDDAAMAMLDAGIWRACRAIYDVKLHTGKATLEDMTELLARESNTTMSAARDDVMGFSRSPGYPLSYLIGKHLVYNLRDELMRSSSRGFNKKKFHDLLAKNGNLPFHLARRVILDDMTSAKAP